MRTELVAESKASAAALLLKSSGKFKLTLAVIKRIEAISGVKTHVGREYKVEK